VHKVSVDDKASSPPWVRDHKMERKEKEKKEKEKKKTPANPNLPGLYKHKHKEGEPLLASSHFPCRLSYPKPYCAVERAEISLLKHFLL
jgi:hypothetical protein